MTTLYCPSCSTQLALVLPSKLPIEDRPEPVDLVELVRRTRVQTAKSAAARMFDTAHPTRAQQERARRKLEHLVDDGDITLRRYRKDVVYVPLADDLDATI